MRRIPLLLAALLLLAPAAAAKGRKGPSLKPGQIHHLVTKKHERSYSLYVPGNYSPRVSWPLVISSHGRGGTGKKEINQWVGLAKEYGFIVACPDMCTATVNRPPKSKLKPHEEDDEVLMAIVREVGAEFRLNPRARMITGFSGGGNPSYYTGLRHPDVFTHIATRGGNFAPHQIPTDEAVLAAGRKKLRIYIYYGEHDHPLILGKDGQPGQAEQARAALEKAGYEHVKFEQIPGMKHESRAKLAAEWFGAYLAENRKKFLAGDKVDELVADAREAAAKGKYREAIRDLGKAEDLEEKQGLDPVAPKEKAALNEIAAKLVADAKAAHSAGETGEALKIVGKVARDFRGLPAAEEAKSLAKEWK